MDCSTKSNLTNEKSTRIRNTTMQHSTTSNPNPPAGVSQAWLLKCLSVPSLHYSLPPYHPSFTNHSLCSNLQLIPPLEIMKEGGINKSKQSEPQGVLEQVVVVVVQNLRGWGSDPNPTLQSVIQNMWKASKTIKEVTKWCKYSRACKPNQLRTNIRVEANHMHETKNILTKHHRHHQYFPTSTNTSGWTESRSFLVAIGGSKNIPMKTST